MKGGISRQTCSSGCDGVDDIVHVSAGMPTHSGNRMSRSLAASVSVIMSGGFAGFDRTPDASSGRAATTTGNKRRQRVTAQVIGDELVAVRIVRGGGKSIEAAHPCARRDFLE